MSLVAAGALALGTAVIGAVATSAHAATSPGSDFLFLGLQAQAGGVRDIVARQVDTGQPEATFDANIPFAHAQLNLSNGHATSSVAWPGALGAAVGSLLAISGITPPIPLNDPVQADADTGSGSPTTTMSLPGGAGTMTATATPALASAAGQIAGDENQTFGTAGTTRASASSSITGAHNALAQAESRVEDVNLGVIRIGSVVSHAKVVTNGVTNTASGDCTVTNMTVAGFPVTVDQNGVHAKGAGTAATKTINAQIQKALAQSGFVVSLTQPLVTTGAGGTTYESGSLLITSDHNWTVIGDSVATAGSALATPYVPPAGAPSNPLAPPVPGVGTPAGNAPVVAPAGTVPPPQTAPTAPLPQLAANHIGLPDGALAPGWLVAALIGAGLIAAGLWRLPDRLLEAQPNPCPLGETP